MYFHRQCFWNYERGCLLLIHIQCVRFAITSRGVLEGYSSQSCNLRQCGYQCERLHLIMCYADGNAILCTPFLTQLFTSQPSKFRDPKLGGKAKQTEAYISLQQSGLAECEHNCQVTAALAM